MEENEVASATVETEVKPDAPQVDYAAENIKLQQALTRQGYELGELRKLADNFLKVEPVKADPVDFFAEPERAVDQRISSNPTVQGLENVTNQLKAQAILNALQSTHPDFKEIVADGDFQNWIGSSKVRQQLFIAADKGYDFDAANELLSNWKERKGIQGKVESEAKAIGDSALKAAKVDTGTSSVSSQKTFSRIDLARLKISDPEKYKTLNVAKLYAQGRVK
jgi:hypothetical protein